MSCDKAMTLSSYQHIYNQRVFCKRSGEESQKLRPWEFENTQQQQTNKQEKKSWGWSIVSTIPKMTR